MAAVVLGEDGLPDAISLNPGLGPPVVSPHSATHLRILLDGQKVESCVAYDRVNGVLWRNQKSAAGDFIVRDEKIVVERVEGKVTVEAVV